VFRDPIVHATIDSQKPTVHKGHPFVNETSHDKLLGYLQQRLLVGMEERDNRLPRMVKVDKDMAGWMRLSDEDKERVRQMDKDGIPAGVQVNLPLTYVHVDDMMTYYAETFAPNRGMFYHTAKAGEHDPANQIVTLMNNHAIYGGMYRQTLKTIFQALKYNIGGFYCYWTTDYGPRISRDGRTTRVEDEPIWSGNKLESLDMYNTMWDPSIDPTDIHKEGEFAARAFMRSHYWLATRANRGVYFNCNDILDPEFAQATSAARYYRHPPTEAMLQLDQSNGGGGNGGRVNWVSILSGGPDYTVGDYEIVEIIIRLNPNDFNLRASKSRANGYELWRFSLLNDKYIIEATPLNNAHGQIPFYFGLVNDDIMGLSAKSPAETIAPLQNFASSLINAHILATRKNIWGVTFYDPTVANFGKIPAGEVAAYVPIEASGYGKDIRASIYRHEGTLDTKQTLQDLGGVFDLVNQFFPTQSLPSQIAGIDRAIDSQVAAVQQGSNRRQHKTAKLLDDSLFRPTRTCMYYNIVQYQEDGVEVNDFTGGTVKVDLDQLKSTDLPFIIGQGLKAIDRMMIAGKVQNIIFALLQSQYAQQVDVLGMIDYWTSMMDMDIDFKQFRIQPATPEGAPEAGAEETPPAEEGVVSEISPMTDPMSLTAPIYG